MKTKINQIDGLDLALQYQEATVDVADIQVEQVGTLPIKFKLLADVSGTVTVNGLPLKNGVGEVVTELTQGLHEVAYDTGFFTLKSSGGLGSFFGDGSDGTIPNLNAITTAPNGGTVANLWDMNAGTVFTTGTLSSASDQVVLSIDFGSPQYMPSSALRIFSLWQASISVGTRNIAVEKSDDGVVWSDVVSTATITTTVGEKGLIAGSPITSRFVRVVLKAGGSNCTLSCQGATINSSPSTGDTQTNLIFRILEPSTLNGAAVVKQYTSYTLQVGYEHTVQNPCQGLVIYSQGDITVNGIIDMSQKAGLAPNGNAIPMLIAPNYIKNAKTSSLLHFDNNITDAQGRTWTNNGGATFDATNKKFGTHAISFNGTSQWIDTPASDDFSFGSEDFTIDFWARPTSVGTDRYLYGTASTGASQLNVDAYLNTSNLLVARIYGDAYTTSAPLTSVTVFSANVWHHVAYFRYANRVYLAIDGVIEASKDFSTSVARDLYKFSIGRTGEYAGNYFVGQIDEFRIVKGKAMYTANFTPHTSAYTYQATFQDDVEAMKKYFQLTTVLQTLRGGYGGNGGYGGGYSGATGRQTSVGIGGAGRQNLGGFGGGGAGGAGGNTGGAGGSILNAEIGGGFLPSCVVSSNGLSGVNGSGGKGSLSAATTVPSIGVCQGGGSGGSGGANSGLASLGTSDSQYAGGFLMLISAGNLVNNGTIRANGGNGSNGSVGANGNAGGGGGGGGAGGGVIALAHKGTYTNTGTVQVNGGAGGTGGVGIGTGETGQNGTAGGVGTVANIQL